MIVTTSQRARPEDIRASMRFADEIGACCVERKRCSLAQLRLLHPAASAGIFVLENEVPVFHAEKGRLFFHPGMSLLRVQNIRRGGSDPLIGTLGLRPGLRLLDCTLGMAADALVAAAVIGPSGSVLGLEISKPIGAITGWGLRRLAIDGGEMTEMLSMPASCIQVLNVEHFDFLCSLPSRSFDVVYFDPMFRTPRQNSPGMKLLHLQGDSRPLSRAVLTQALRVCCDRVVVKETSESSEFSRLGLQRRSGGRYSPVGYGILFPGDLL